MAYPNPDSTTESAVRAVLMRVFEGAMRIAVPLLLGIAGWTMTTLVDHESRLRYIEGTRYTLVDRDRDVKDVATRLESLAVGQAAMQEKIAGMAGLVERIEKRLDGTYRGAR